MPTYEFQCKRCRQITEITCRASDRELTYPCEYCGSTNTVRVYSPVRHTWEMAGMSIGEIMSQTEKSKRDFEDRQ